MAAALIAKLGSTVRLTDEDRQSLSAAAVKRRTVPARQDFCSESAPVDGMFVVLQGFVARFRTLASGKRQIVGYALPGDVVEPADGASRLASYGLCALADSTIARIPADDMATMMSESPRIARAIWNAKGEQMSIVCEWLLNVGQRNAEQRIAHLFCEQYFRLRAIGQAQNGSFAFPLTQRDLADSVGITNVHVNRVLQTLRQDRLVSFDGATVAILDLDGLISRAEFDPHYLRLPTD